MIPIKDYNYTRTKPYITRLLLIINIVVFIYQLYLKILPDIVVQNQVVSRLYYFIYNYSFIGSRFIAEPQVYWYTIITSMFLHGGFLHIIGNMLYLVIFGDNIEDCLGHFKFLFFYLIAGIAGSLLQLLFSVDPNIPNIGASGAISGIIGGYIILFPFKKILTIIPIFIFPLQVKLPAFLLLGLWIFMQFNNGITAITQGAFNNVAYMAHIGGLLAGIVYVLPRRKKLLRKTILFKAK